MVNSEDGGRADVVEDVSGSSGAHDGFDDVHDHDDDGGADDNHSRDDDGCCIM